MLYKAGDLVIAHPELGRGTGGLFGERYISDRMLRYKGMKTKVIEVIFDSFNQGYLLEIDGGESLWTDKTLKPFIKNKGKFELSEDKTMYKTISLSYKSAFALDNPYNFDLRLINLGNYESEWR